MSSRNCWRRPPIATIVAIASASLSVGGSAQAVTVPHAVTCPRCSVITEKLVTLGGTGDDLLADANQVVRDSRGRYFAQAWGGRTMLVWDSTGKLIGKFGAAGAGPGEFGGNIQSMLVDPYDSIVVVDRGLRASVFSPALTFVRSFRLPGRSQGLARMPNGQFVLGAPVSTPGQIGHPYHIIDGATGAIVRSFGGDGAVVRPDQPPDSYRSFFVPSWDGRYIWHPLLRGYTVERWNVETGTREVFDMSSAPWYVAPTPLPRMSPAEEAALLRVVASGSRPAIDSMERANIAKRPPASGATVMRIDRDGRLWVMGSEARQSGPPDDANRKYLVEIIDPATRTKLLSVPFSTGFVSGIRGTDLVVSRHSDGNGVTTLTVWRVRVGGR
jgi:hypothetical protein